MIVRLTSGLQWGLAMLERILPEAARRSGDNVALIAGGRSFSYAQLDELSDAFAGALRSRGVGVGDRVSIYSQNRWEWIVAYHGILKAGCVVNPINVMLTPEEVVFVLNDCGSRAIVTSLDKAAAVTQLRSEAPALENVIVFGDGPEDTIAFEPLLAAGERAEAVAEPSPTSLSTIAYTSGTTGHPKGAMQSHLAVYLNCALTAAMHVRTVDDIVVTALPARTSTATW